MADDSTKKALTILERKLHQDIKPMLLTGAGFSYGAKNSNGQSLPLGDGLCKLLVTDLLGLDENSDDPRFNDAIRVLNNFGKRNELKSRIRRSNSKALAYARALLTKQDSDRLISDDILEDAE